MIRVSLVLCLMLICISSVAWAATVQITSPGQDVIILIEAEMIEIQQEGGDLVMTVRNVSLIESEASSVPRKNIPPEKLFPLRDTIYRQQFPPGYKAIILEKSTTKRAAT